MIRLSILVATIGHRNDKFEALMNYLMPLTERWPIEVIAYWNTGELSIGEIRQRLLEEATGEYVCFIDDDDWVPDWYCAEIMAALGKDYVGFEVELLEKDKKMPPVFHSIRYGVWHQDDKGYYRGVTHLNPIKRELALSGQFSQFGIGEDESWSRTVTPNVRTENYIDKVMYYYHHDPDETMFGGKVKPHKDYERVDFKHPQFRYHPDSKLSGRM
jgi:glycosyltransferase involved in cell wall biosynthesis